MEVSYECRQDLVCSADEIRSMEKLFSDRGSLRRRFGGAALELLRAVSRHGLCPTDLALNPEFPLIALCRFAESLLTAIKKHSPNEINASSAKRPP